MAKRTIRRRVRKNKTIRKVMRGCNRRHSRAKVGGGVQAPQYTGGGASPQANANLATGTASLLEAQQNAGNKAPLPPTPIQSSMAPAPREAFSLATNAARVGGGSQYGGGARTRHHKRRLRYKKSIARKSRHV